MNWNKDKTFRLVGWLLLLAFFWFFTEIVLYLIIASIIGVASQPFMKLLAKVQIRNKSLPKAVNASVIMLLFFVLFGGFIAILVPAINNQAQDLMKVDFHQIGVQMGGSLNILELKMRSIGFLNQSEQIETIISQRLTGFVSNLQVDNIFSSLLSMTGSLFMGFFSIVFMSFFFIKDDTLFQQIIMLFVIEKNQKNTYHILLKIKKTLTRYFTGILIEVSTMMFLITIGGLILGLKNALLIGFIGGFMNIIPYIGPLIGASIGASLVAMTNMYLGMDTTLALMGGIMVVFAVANMIDNFLLQPIIYSNSVNAHPLEIFIVIIMAGTMAGPAGMIVAIPVYTIIRITAKEFLGDQGFIQRTMKDI
jgi:predicted PurR-regulated permease PerM